MFDSRARLSQWFPCGGEGSARIGPLAIVQARGSLDEAAPGRISGGVGELALP